MYNIEYSLFYVLILTTVCLAKNLPEPEFGEELANHINNLKTTWTATSDNRFSRMGLESAKRYLGRTKANVQLPVKVFDKLNYEIPESFDAREKWGTCSSIKLVRDQSNCGSCWAVATASAFSDRICIHSKGEKDTLISSDHLLSCEGLGCEGGNEVFAWMYIESNGIVTGGQYGDNSTCKPYPFPSCAHHMNSTDLPPCTSLPDYQAPECPVKCDNDIDFESDKHYVKDIQRIHENDIQREIFENGPVSAGFIVYSDFLLYKEGVYQSTPSKLLSGHAVKMIGWGVENDTPYWLIANSWNEEWGDQGLFKIKRGSNECGIEEDVFAGIPKL